MQLPVANADLPDYNIPPGQKKPPRCMTSAGESVTVTVQKGILPTDGQCFMAAASASSSPPSMMTDTVSPCLMP